MSLYGSKHEHIYSAKFHDAEGNLVWEDVFENLVPDAWLNKILEYTYKQGTGPAAFYVGLVTGPGASNTYAAGDTMTTHAGWTAATPYSDGARPACTFGSVANKAVDNSASAAVFNINANATIAGCFLTTDATKTGTAGFLCGVGNFSSGDKPVTTGGTLTVTVTATAA